MVDNSGKILNKVKPGRIIFPLLIGIAVSAFLMRDFDFQSLTLIKLTASSIIFLLIAFLLMAIRDIGYIWRIRILSNNELSWGRCLNIVMLWEFTSAITPSAVGGTSVAIFFINKEGINLGKSSAIVLMTSLLDELYFIITFPLVVLFLDQTDLFSIRENSHFFWVAVIGYSIKLVYSIFVFYGLLLNPRGLKWLLLFIFRLPIIRRWRPKANESGNDLLEASAQFKNWPIKYWIKAFIATGFSWTSRYWVVNALILFMFGYNYLYLESHILVFAKQLLMWIMMLVTPTPGGAGFAEYIFKEFLSGDLPQGMENFMSFLWRLVSYYPYLLIGAFLIPRWIRKRFIQV
ncbi:MAG: flippase-like domain-containing protein [Marinilabiliaceae bacterium]|nr:flippase-like domain-containing protein [Marinilabiliaceae bacterium]